ncbi:hypothetical protein ABK040_005189 [Willaertia magna]
MMMPSNATLLSNLKFLLANSPNVHHHPNNTTNTDHSSSPNTTSTSNHSSPNSNNSTSSSSLISPRRLYASFFKSNSSNNLNNPKDSNNLNNNTNLVIKRKRRQTLQRTNSNLFLEDLEDTDFTKIIYNNNLQNSLQNNKLKKNYFNNYHCEIVTILINDKNNNFLPISLFEHENLLNENNNIYFTYIIRITKNKIYNSLQNTLQNTLQKEENELKMESKSWTVVKRYNQFIELNKEIKNYIKINNLNLNLPKLPPKLFLKNNFKIENILKRKENLQFYLNFIFENLKEFKNLEEVNEYFLFNKIKKNKIYKFKNEIFVKILQFCTFDEIFPKLVFVCKWWKDLIYNSFKSLDIVYCNENIFFLKININIDIMEELINLIIKFKNIVNLRLHKFYNLNDLQFQIILENLNFLENLEIIDCGLKLPNLDYLKNKKIKSIDFNHNLNLENIIFKNYLFGNFIFHLDLSDTKINDLNLQNCLQNCKNLNYLNLTNCNNLNNIFIENLQVLEILILRFCKQLKNIHFKICKNLLFLDLSYTSIKDKHFNAFFNYLMLCTNLEVLKVNGCNNLIHPILNFTMDSLQRRESLDSSFDSNDFNFNSPIVINIPLQRLEMSSCNNIVNITVNFPSIEQIVNHSLLLPPNNLQKPVLPTTILDSTNNNNTTVTANNNINIPTITLEPITTINQSITKEMNIMYHFCLNYLDLRLTKVDISIIDYFNNLFTNVFQFKRIINEAYVAQETFNYFSLFFATASSPTHNGTRKLSVSSGCSTPRSPRNGNTCAFLH